MAIVSIGLKDYELLYKKSVLYDLINRVAKKEEHSLFDKGEVINMIAESEEKECAKEGDAC